MNFIDNYCYIPIYSSCLYIPMQCFSSKRKIPMQCYGMLLHSCDICISAILITHVKLD